MLSYLSLCIHVFVGRFNTEGWSVIAGLERRNVGECTAINITFVHFYRWYPVEFSELQGKQIVYC
jgi:hypothetical protein